MKGNKASCLNRKWCQMYHCLVCAVTSQPRGRWKITQMVAVKLQFSLRCCVIGFLMFNAFWLAFCHFGRKLIKINIFSSAENPHIDLFSTRPQPKKKRKSRTAFTNHQIFELEKRFLYQKYLSPADRDEIAAGLGLSNAQVIYGQNIETHDKIFPGAKYF